MLVDNQAINPINKKRESHVKTNQWECEDQEKSTF